MLNLKVSTILDISDRLYKEYTISSTFLEKVMEKYTIQTIGKDTLEKQWGIDQPTQYMVSQTRHYSWPKGGGKCMQYRPYVFVIKIKLISGNLDKLFPALVLRTSSVSVSTTAHVLT